MQKQDIRIALGSGPPAPALDFIGSESQPSAVIGATVLDGRKDLGGVRRATSPRTTNKPGYSAHSAFLGTIEI
jgi:hypothetical protein